MYNVITGDRLVCRLVLQIKMQTSNKKIAKYTHHKSNSTMLLVLRKDAHSIEKYKRVENNSLILTTFSSNEKMKPGCEGVVKTYHTSTYFLSCKNM